MQTYKPLKILQASAGSGKTFSLAAHYLILLFSGENKYREILAVTFTNKATAEMKSRILEVLEALARGTSGADAYRPLILEALPFFTPETLQQKATQVYRQILHDYNRFSVNTIDGFVQKVIRSFSYELGLDAGYRLEMNLEKVKLDLADRLNKRLDEKPSLLEWIISLVMQRLADNKSWNYHATLVELSGELFKERYVPFEEALRDHDAAAIFRELKEQTTQIIGDFEKNIVKKALEARQLFDDSGVLIEELKGKSRSPLKNLSRIADGEFKYVAALEKMLNEPEEWQKGGLSAAVSGLYSVLNPKLVALWDLYREQYPVYATAKAVDSNMYYLRLMQEMGGLLGDYREENQALLISDAQNLLKGITGGLDANPSFVWEKTGNRYRHFLFDEFQDTSRMQWSNFLPLVQNALASPGEQYTDHLIVGDVKQSIYRWRGGDWKILLQKAQKDLNDWNVSNDSLEENYRSSANIILFNNFLFRHIPGLLQNLINEQVTVAADTAYQEWWTGNGYAQIITAAYAQSQQLPAKNTPAGGAVHVEFLDVENNKFRGTQIAEAALRKLNDHLESWVKTDARPGNRYDAGQICILVRSNREAREVISYLMSRQQEKEPADRFQVLSGEALLISGNEAVQLLINTLRAMTGKRSDLSLYLANSVKMYATLQNRELEPGDWLQFANLQPEDMKAFLPEELCSNWQAWQRFPLGGIAEKLIVAFGLDKMTPHVPYLLAFRDLLAGFARQGERGIRLFLQWWDEEGCNRALPSAEHSEAVQVMTIHKSKGLAFDVVMLPFCSWPLDGRPNSVFWVETGETPYSRIGSAPVSYTKELGNTLFQKAYAEELLSNYMDALNMLYVAVTRTRFHLYITAPGVSGNGADI
ncbi:MAG: UvrD-helicase domain-containing protein, partial [Mucilaginibacter polytrichastri]|nr:UvrD-helicase domain-containing protein [Mucilaginibacter polytrichastri]